MADGTCVCRRPRINLVGVCQVCGLERLHIVPKVAPTVVESPAEEAA
jgi:hypothetical protein